jgi:hypothetical protein
MNGIGKQLTQNQQAAIERHLTFIPVLESGALNDAHSVYITTGEYPPPIRDLHRKSLFLHLCSSGFMLHLILILKANRLH